MWSKILNTLKDIFTSFFSPLARQIARGGGVILLEAAMEAVKRAEEYEGKPSSEKFDLAKSIVIARLKANSIPIITNAVHGAIEAAVARLQEGR